MEKLGLGYDALARRKSRARLLLDLRFRSDRTDARLARVRADRARAQRLRSRLHAMPGRSQRAADHRHPGRRRVDRRVRVRRHPIGADQTLQNRPRRLHRRDADRVRDGAGHRRPADAADRNRHAHSDVQGSARARRLRHAGDPHGKGVRDRCVRSSIRTCSAIRASIIACRAQSTRPSCATRSRPGRRSAPRASARRR